MASDSKDDGLDLSNRMIIFRHLAISELSNQVNYDIFNGLLDQYYDKFIETCEYVKGHSDTIKSVTCYMENGEIVFDFQYKSEEDHE